MAIGIPEFATQLADLQAQFVAGDIDQGELAGGLRALWEESENIPLLFQNMQEVIAIKATILTAFQAALQVKGTVASVSALPAGAVDRDAYKIDNAADAKDKHLYVRVAGAWVDLGSFGGDAGRSGYQVAVANGFTGTETEYGNLPITKAAIAQTAANNADAKAALAQEKAGLAVEKAAIAQAAADNADAKAIAAQAVVDGAETILDAVPLAEAARDAAEASRVSAEMTRNTVQGSMPLLFASPNLFPDADLTGLFAKDWSADVPTSQIGGRPALVFTGVTRTQRTPVAMLGGPGAIFSAGLIVENLTWVSGGANLILIRQLDIARNPISGTSVTLLQTGANTSTSQSLTTTAQTIHADAAFVELYISSGGNAGNVVTASQIGLYKGASAAYRPGVTGRVPSVSDLYGVLAGLARLYGEPNLFPDKTMTGVGWSGPMTTSRRAGRKTLRATGGDRYVRLAASALGDPGATFSVGVTVEAVGYTSGAANSVLVRQLTSGGAVISGTTVTLNNSSTKSFVEATPAVAEAMVLDATAAFVELYLQASGNAANFVEVSLIGFYKGDTAFYRPVMDGLATTPDLYGAVAGVARLYSEPNLFPDKSMSGVGWSGALTTGRRSGRKTLKTTGGDRYIRVAASVLGGPGATFSAGVTVEAMGWTGGSANSVLIRQLTSAAAVISGTTQTIYTGSNRTFTEPTPGVLENVTIDASAAYIEFYLQASGNAANYVEISLAGLYKGDSALYRPPMDGLATTPDLYGAVAGLSRLFSEPNVFPDASMSGAGWSGAMTTSTRDGRKTLRATGADRYIRVPASTLGGPGATFSVGVVVEAVGYTSGGANTVIVRQLTTGFAAISGKTKAVYNASASSFEEIRRGALEAEVIDDNAAFVEIYIQAGGNAANFVELSLVGLYKGDSAVYRPAPVGGDPATAIANAAYGVEKLFAEPNLFPDPELRYTGIVSGMWTGVRPAATTSRGRRAIVLDGSKISYLNMPAEWFGGPGATFSATVTVENVVSGGGYGVFIWVRFYDAAGSEIAGSVQQLLSSNVTNPSEQVLKLEGATIPAGCATVRLYLDTNSSAGTSMTLSRIGFYRGAKADYRPAIVTPARTVFVDGATGADSNLGTATSPFATPERGLMALRRPDLTYSGRMVIAAGDYPMSSLTLGTISGSSLGNAYDLIVEAAPNARVRFILGNKLVSVTKTAGRTNVYQAALAAAAAPANFVLEHDSPEGLISLAERHALHLGETHRSPVTRLRPVADLAACDATPSSHYYAGGVLYFHAPGSSDPTTSGKEYYVPLNQTSWYRTSGIATEQGGRIGYVEVRGIQVWYAYEGFQMGGVSSYKLINCTAVGCAGRGFDALGASGEEVNCRSIACGEDGFAYAAADGSPGVLYQDPRTLCINPYAAMNGDDGWSSHIRCNAVIIGGLSEYNDDGGFIPVLGAEVVAYGSHARKNGQRAGINGAIGEGFSVRQAPAGTEGGVNTCLVGYDLISEGNTRNFCVGDAGGNVTLYRPLSMNASSFGYASLNTGAAMTVVDGKTLNDATAKYGTVTVITPAALT